MKKIILMLVISLFILTSCASIDNVKIHENYKVSYVDHGIGMVPDCKKSKHLKKIKKSNRAYKVYKNKKFNTKSDRVRIRKIK